MLRVANKGILFKVYRGVPLTFAMTSQAARGCAVGNVGGYWTEIFSPLTSLRKSPKHPPEVSRCPAGCPSSSRRKSLVVPSEVPSPRPSAALRCLMTWKRSCLIVAPWGFMWLCHRLLLGTDPCSRQHRPAVKILQATTAFRLKMSLDIPAPRGLPLRRRYPPRPPSG